MSDRIALDQDLETRRAGRSVCWAETQTGRTFLLSNMNDLNTVGFTLTPCAKCYYTSEVYC